MILASHSTMLLQHYGVPVILALNRCGSDTGREFEMIRKHSGGQGVEALVCEHFACHSASTSPDVRYSRERASASRWRFGGALALLGSGERCTAARGKRQYLTIA